MVNPEFRRAVDDWRRDPWALQALFTVEEVQRLEKTRRRIRHQRRTIAYCAYENPFA